MQHLDVQRVGAFVAEACGRQVAVREAQIQDSQQHDAALIPFIQEHLAVPSLARCLVPQHERVRVHVHMQDLHGDLEQQ